MMARHYTRIAIILCISLILSGNLTPMPIQAQEPSDNNVYLPVISRGSSGQPTPTPTPSSGLLASIGNKTVPLGSTLLIQLRSNRTSAAFGISPLPLPRNTSFDVTTGTFRFTPEPKQVGTYQVTFSAVDGQEKASETVTITVPNPDPTASTSLRGRILDANDAALGKETPLVGATVRLVVNGNTSTKTDSAGYFELNGLDAGENYIEYDGSTATPNAAGAPYGAYRSKKNLMGHVTNIIDRPIYIMAIDRTGQTQIDPNSTTTLVNPTLGVTVNIEAHTVVRDDGSEYAGPISISEVPDEFTPSSLPDWLDPSQVFTVQPMGLTFEQPAKVTFPNTGNLPIGTVVNIWSMDHKTARFFVAGQARVTSKDFMTTIAGGIRESSWHFPMPPSSSRPEPEPDNPGDYDMPDACATNMASSVEIADGCLRTSISLPAYVSQGEVRPLNFVYNAQHVYPHPMVSFSTILPSSSAIPDLLSYGLHDLDGVRPSPATYFDTSRLFKGQDNYIRGVVPIDGSGFATGIYSYTIRITNHYGEANVSTDMNGSTMLVNDRNSAFGSGWALAGLQRLYPQPDGRILLTDGDGTALTFYAVSNRIGAFDKNRASNYAFVSGSDFVAAQNSVRQNFADIAYSEFSTLTTEALQGVSILILTSQQDFVSPLEQPLSTSEQDVLSNFVRSGGCAMLMVDGTSSDAANNSLLSVFGIGDVIGNPATATGVLVNDPSRSAVTKGPFGEVPNFWQLHPGALTALGSYAKALAANQTGTALAVIEPNVIAPGSGGVVIFSDIDMFTSGPGSVGIFTQYPQNKTLLLNTVQFCRGTSGNAPQFYQGAKGDYSTLTRNGDGSFTRRMKDGITMQFRSDGRQIAVTDRNSNSISYSYDNQGRLIRINDPVNQAIQLRYEGNYLKEVSDPANRKTLFTHNASGLLTQVTFPDSTKQEFGYDPNHLMTSEKDRRGFTRTRVYDSWGHLKSATLPGNVTRELTYSQSIGLHDPASGLGTHEKPAPLLRSYLAQSTLTDGEGHTTGYEVNAFGQAKIIRDPANLQTAIAHDSNGNVTGMAPPGYATSYDYRYDKLGNMLEFTDRDVQHRSLYSYENRFNQLTSIEITSETLERAVWQYGYDDRGNLTSVTTPLIRTNYFSYNSQGLPLIITDTKSIVTRFAYNAAGNATQVAVGPVAAPRTTRFSYTTEGYLQTLTDPSGRNFSYLYDAFGRVTQETLPGNRTISYAYDGEGNLLSLTPPGRPVHQFTYDGLGQITEYKPPAVTGSGSTHTTYAYNKAQQLTQVTRPDSKTIRFTYDHGGRLVAQIEPRGTITYGYHIDNGRLYQAYAPDGVRLEYQYTDELLTKVTLSGPVAGEVQYDYDKNYRLSSDSVQGSYLGYFYDLDSALNRITNFSGFDLQLNYQPSSGVFTGTSLDKISDQQNYNTFGELASYRAVYNTSTSLFGTAYAYDTLGRITTLTETINGVSNVAIYGYDAAGRLAFVQRNGAAAATYSYDANGNRLSGTYDTQDRLLSLGSASYSYTANGELLTKTENGKTTTYNYDATGNLMGVTLPDGKSITYLVDAQNRRVGRKVNGVLEKGFLYRDQLNPIAELDKDGKLVSRFVYGSKSNVPDAMIRDGVNYRIISDHLGSVRLVVNATTGAIAQRMDYDAWGKVLQDSSPGFQPFGFAGGIYDADTGLVRFGARDYDAMTGRWTTKDPIGFAGGDTNLYAYAGNDPVNFIDNAGTVLQAVAVVIAVIGWTARATYQGYRTCRGNPLCGPQMKEVFKYLREYYGFLFGDIVASWIKDMVGFSEPLTPPSVLDNDEDGMPDPIDAYPRDPNRKHPWDPPKTFNGDFDLNSLKCYT